MLHLSLSNTRQHKVQTKYFSLMEHLMLHYNAIPTEMYTCSTCYCIKCIFNDPCLKQIPIERSTVAVIIWCPKSLLFSPLKERNVKFNHYLLYSVAGKWPSNISLFQLCSQVTLANLQNIYTLYSFLPTQENKFLVRVCDILGGETVDMERTLLSVQGRED